MTAPFRLSIQQFIGHFRKQLLEIELVQSEQFQQTLYSLMLDPLATAAYSQGGSRKNVVQLLRDFADWPDVNRVSRTQLKLALRFENEVAGSLYKEVVRQIKNQPLTNSTLLSQSPDKSTLLAFATSKNEQKLLDLCTYGNLFYTFRCNLAHEFRPPGYGTDWGRGRAYPYYGTSSFDKFQLVFPLGFFARITSAAVSNLEIYLLTNKIAPHSKFKLGSLWSCN